LPSEFDKNHTTSLYLSFAAITAVSQDVI